MNMPASARLLLIACGAVCLTACATPAARTPPEPEPGRILIDRDYVQTVERQALRRGMTVQWVHPPVRRVPDDSN